VIGQQQVFRFLFKEVNKQYVKCLRGKIADGIAANVSGLWIVEWRKVMRDVDQCEGWINLQQLAFDGANEVILLPDI
jgi:hypothetical protein